MLHRVLRMRWVVAGVELLMSSRIATIGIRRRVGLVLHRGLLHRHLLWRLHLHLHLLLLLHEVCRHELVASEMLLLLRLAIDARLKLLLLLIISCRHKWGAQSRRLRVHDDRVLLRSSCIRALGRSLLLLLLLLLDD